MHSYRRKYHALQAAHATLLGLVQAYEKFGKCLELEASYKHWDEKSGRYTIDKVLKWWKAVLAALQRGRTGRGK
jgi:hypothetical protein